MDNNDNNNQLIERIEKLETIMKCVTGYIFHDDKYVCQSFVDMLNTNCDNHDNWTIDNIADNDYCTYHLNYVGDKRISKFVLCKQCESFVTCRNFYHETQNR